jgi:hypothetical protein
MWKSLIQSSRRYLQQDTATRSEIVELVPFDVTIGLKQENDAGVDVFALTDIVEDWLGESFEQNDLGEDFARFTTVILDYQDRRELQTTMATFVASYEGVTVWTRQGDLLVPDETVVAAIQTQAFLQEEGLLEALQAADPSTGLGDAVTNVRASINSSGGDGGGSSTTGGLDVIIIVAIVIAGLAFVLLSFALYMAWRHSKETERKGHALGSPEGTGDESDFGEASASGKRASAAAKAATQPALPTEVEASASGLYPESVISEDISTSLTAYYQSGMGSKRMQNGNTNNNNVLNDAASVSSMESYGYSLDGYTNSIAPTDAKDDPY